MSLRMSVVLCWVSAALALAPAAHASEGQELAASAGATLIGKPAPALELRTIDGTEIDLAQLYGRKPVYLKFWATWCVPCREQMPHLERTFERRHRDIAVIAVNAGFDDTVADISTYRAQMGLKMPIVRDDGRLADAFHLRVTPQHIVIGRDGRILYIGHLADEKLEAALAAAVAERPSVPGTRATATANPTATALSVGDTVGALTVKTLEGAELSLTDATRAQRTILAFISPWCESYLATSRPTRSQACREARESIEASSKAGGQERVIGIASGLWADQQDVLDYQREHHLPVPLTVDESGKLFHRFGVQDVPTFIVIDSDGHIVSKSSRWPGSSTSSRSG